MVSSLAALIPQPAIDRSRSGNADSNPDRAERSADARQPAFGDMIASRQPPEARKPLPQRAADRAEDARSRTVPPRSESASANADARAEAHDITRDDSPRADRADRPAKTEQTDTCGHHGQDEAVAGEYAPIRGAKPEAAKVAKTPDGAPNEMTPAEAEIAMIEDAVVAALLEEIGAELGEIDGELPDEVSIEILPEGVEADGTELAIAVTATAKAVATEATIVANALAPAAAGKQTLADATTGADEASGEAGSINSGDRGATSGEKAISALSIGTAHVASEPKKTQTPGTNSNQAPASPQVVQAADMAALAAQTGTAAEAKAEGVKATAFSTMEPAKANTPSAKEAQPRAGFADWMQEFAHFQGAIHRSGDLVGSLDRAANGLTGQIAGQDALRPTPLQMLPIEIGMQAMRGITTFQIRLDPDELGRVDVKLEIHESGEVEASLVVDRVETLAMLRRDAPTLQQAFEQAGFKQSEGGLQFSLRGESQGRDGQGRDDRQQRHGLPGEDQQPLQNQIAEIAMRRMMIPNSSIDRIV